jgi:preprotein translocase subunit SecG
METAVIIVSVLLISIVLLQSGKAESANIIQGGSSELFQNRKERGLELFISRLTFILGFTFFVLCTFISFM